MKTELDSAWESAIHNAERARKAEAEVERLRAELAVERKRVSSYRTLVSSLESQISRHRANASEAAGAIRTLDSERAANATLTAELAELLAAIEAMRVAGGAAEFQRAFDEAKIIAARKGEGA